MNVRDRIGIMPSAQEISGLEALHEWLLAVGNEKERRALLAWAASRQVIQVLMFQGRGNSRPQGLVE